MRRVESRTIHEAGTQLSSHAQAVKIGADAVGSMPTDPAEIALWVRG
jgi:hypothetical protein